ncbi:DNA-directed RNA polymerase subunit omega [Acetobacterium bakii]|uniref:DNA-directed RNA polymerase subunit omega n=1 Tax=Acetobacterium bakii TaxID=52689 RepID=A0A0L6TVA9_9FIRM|nr:DNA-directed RNA polymerase subunit omega [Acetobacterium bakii]KNZ40214.1 hypothetical protein AKG39_18830 [Acetobacterium bakii]
MRYPALNDLIAKADNKYSLVLATAKRAREIIDGDEPLVKIKIDNPVTIATNEIAEDMIHCIYNEGKPHETAIIEETEEAILLDVEAVATTLITKA